MFSSCCVMDYVERRQLSDEAAEVVAELRPVVYRADGAGSYRCKEIKWDDRPSAPLWSAVLVVCFEGSVRYYLEQQIVWLEEVSDGREDAAD